MERRDNGLKIAVVAALIISVLGVAVGFAAFSTTLNINGTATVEAANWDVHFIDLTKGTFTANEVTAPTIKEANGKAATAIGDYKVKFTKPGQVATYTFKVTNAGTYNASLASQTVGQPVCTGTGENATTDAANVCGKLTYTLTGAPANGTLLAVGGTTSVMTLTLTYVDFEDETLLPKQPVEVSGLGVSFVYNQVD